MLSRSQTCSVWRAMASNLPSSAHGTLTGPSIIMPFQALRLRDRPAFHMLMSIYSHAEVNLQLIKPRGRFRVSLARTMGWFGSISRQIHRQDAAGPITHTNRTVSISKSWSQPSSRMEESPVSMPATTCGSRYSGQLSHAKTLLKFLSGMLITITYRHLTTFSRYRSVALQSQQSSSMMMEHIRKSVVLTLIKIGTLERLLAFDT